MLHWNGIMLNKAANHKSLFAIEYFLLYVVHIRPWNILFGFCLSLDRKLKIYRKSIGTETCDVTWRRFGKWPKLDWNLGPDEQYCSYLLTLTCVTSVWLFLSLFYSWLFQLSNRPVWAIQRCPCSAIEMEWANEWTKYISSWFNLTKWSGTLQMAFFPAGDTDDEETRRDPWPLTPDPWPLRPFVVFGRKGQVVPPCGVDLSVSCLKLCPATS